MLGGIAVLFIFGIFSEMYAQSMEIIPIFAFIGGLSVLVFSFYTFAYRNGKLSVKFFFNWRNWYGRGNQCGDVNPIHRIGK